MQIKGAFDPTNLLNIDFQRIIDFITAYFFAKGLDVVFKKVNLHNKARFCYYALRSIKYQILYIYEGWRIDRKSGYANSFINRSLSKTEQYYLLQQIISGILYKPGEAPEGFKIWWPLFKNLYPERFKEFFGESKSEIQAKLNIERFFQNVFA